jgi:hypothetical protein
VRAGAIRELISRLRTLARTITRMIRDGRGPFRNQVTASGTHIHHPVPGIILLIIGAFTAVSARGSLGWLADLTENIRS